MNRVHTTHSWDFLGIDSILQYNQLPMALSSHSFAQYFILASIFLLFVHASVIFSGIYRTSKAKLTWVLLKNLCLWIHQFMGQQSWNQNQN